MSSTKLQTHTERSGMDHTVLPANYTIPAFLFRKRSPDGATTNRWKASDWSLPLIYRPRRDERLSWPGWLTYSGWLTHISGYPSATGRAQDREVRRPKDRRYTTVPRNHTSNFEANCKEIRKMKKIIYKQFVTSCSRGSAGADAVHRAVVIQQQLQQLPASAAQGQERLPHSHLVRFASCNVVLLMFRIPFRPWLRV